MPRRRTERDPPPSDNFYGMQLRYPILALPLLTLVAGWRIHLTQSEPDPASSTEIVTSTTAPERPEADQTLRFTEHSMEIAGAARQLLEAPNRSFRDDCSGYISSVYTRAGIEMDGTVAQIYEAASQSGLLHHHPIPRIGDLVFFDNTHDRNKNGVWDDLRTHIGVVVDVEPDGTAVVAHKGSRYALLRLNLLHPMDKEGPEGQVWNGHLRRYGRSDQWSLYLASQLWSGFATVDPEVDWP